MKHKRTGQRKNKKLIKKIKIKTYNSTRLPKIYNQYKQFLLGFKYLNYINVNRPQSKKLQKMMQLDSSYFKRRSNGKKYQEKYGSVKSSRETKNKQSKCQPINMSKFIETTKHILRANVYRMFYDYIFGKRSFNQRRNQINSIDGVIQTFFIKYRDILNPKQNEKLQKQLINQYSISKQDRKNDLHEVHIQYQKFNKWLKDCEDNLTQDEIRAQCFYKWNSITQLRYKMILLLQFCRLIFVIEKYKRQSSEKDKLIQIEQIEWLFIFINYKYKQEIDLSDFLQSPQDYTKKINILFKKFCQFCVTLYRDIPQGAKYEKNIQDRFKEVQIELEEYLLIKNFYVSPFN